MSNTNVSTESRNLQPLNPATPVIQGESTNAASEQPAKNQNAYTLAEKEKAPESPFLLTMKEHFPWFWRMACLYGVIYTFCLYDNPDGITCPAAVAVTILFSVLWLHKAGMTVKRHLFFYFTGMTLLGVSTCLTANDGILFFNTVGILLLFCAAMLHQMYEDGGWSFSGYMKRLLLFAGTCMASLLKPFEHMLYHLSKQKSKNASEKKTEEALEKKKQTSAVLAGAGIAALFLMCVMPLLLGSDQVFAIYFKKCFSFPDITLPDISAGIRVFLCFLSGFLFLYVFFAALFRHNLTGFAEKERHRANALTGITFTAILAFIYVLYSGIQIVFLFLRQGLPDGMTYSQYAHEGFWQLLAVTLINIVTVLVCIQVFEDRPALRILLLVISLCTCVMTVSAAYRMMLYVGVYHLTFLRILVLWFLGVLTLVMGGVMISIFRHQFHLFHYITAVVACCYIGFSFAGVDGIIASYNLRHTAQIGWQDVSYLLYGLSYDAAPYVEMLAEMDIEKYSVSEDDYYSNREHPYEGYPDPEELKEYKTIGNYLEPEITDYMKRIANREKLSLRKWNFARARARKTAEEYLKKH